MSMLGTVLTRLTEQFHNTPDTQTDESYNHPEDLEHFAMHESIERKEAEKEAEFAGLSVEEVLVSHEHDGEKPPPIPVSDEAASAPVGQDDRLAPKYTRVPKPEKADPVAKYLNAKKDSQAQGEWGEGDGGYKTPKNPADKMRKNIPYKASRHVLDVLEVSLTNLGAYAVQVQAQLGRLLEVDGMDSYDRLYNCYVHTTVHFAQVSRTKSGV
jgi:hypothetical protein